MPRATSTTCRAQASRCAFRPIGGNRRDEVVDTDASRVTVAARGEANVLPALSPAAHPNGTVEAVRIRERDDTLGAVELEVADVVALRLEACDEVGRHAALELDRRSRVRGRLHGEPLAGARADLDRALARARRCKPRDPRHRAEQRDDRGQVVRAHVEQRAGTVRGEDVRIGVPALLPADEHGGAHATVARRSRRHRAARGRPGRHCRERCPVRTRSVARAGPASATRCGRVGGVRGQRLLGVDVLARGERGADHGRVCGRRRQVEDDVDRRVADEVVHGGDPEVMRLGQRARLRLVDVGAGDELERVESLRVLRVLAADHTTADDADAHGRAHVASTATIAVRASSDRRAASSAGPSVSSCSTSSHSAPAATAAGATSS